MIGVGSELEIFATNEGFVAIGFFGKSALIFAVYPVVMGMRITANDEDSGVMDVLLSLPVERARVIIEKFLAYGLSCVGVVLLIYLGLHLGVLLGGVDLDVARLAEITFYLIPLMVFIMAFTVLIAVLARRRTIALGIVTAFIIVSYMLQTIGAAAEGTVAEPLGLGFVLDLLQRGRHSVSGLYLAAYRRIRRLVRSAARRVAVSIRKARYRHLTRGHAGACAFRWQSSCCSR